MTIDQIVNSEGGSTQLIEQLQQELREKTYKAQAIRRTYIDKQDGGQRPLGIPTVRDRVVQMAAYLIPEPIFEADFEDCSYGFRRGRNAHQALDKIREHIGDGFTEVYDADLKGYLDRSSQCTPADQTLSKSAGCWSSTLIRRPFRFPRRTRTAWSSPRFTRCHTV